MSPSHRSNAQRHARRWLAAWSAISLLSLGACVHDIDVGPRGLPDAASDIARGETAAPDTRSYDALPDTRTVPVDAPMPFDDGGCGNGGEAGDADNTVPIEYWPTGPTTAQFPISGGTLAVSRSQSIAIASDPDHNAVWLVDLGTLVAHSIDLMPGDEPGRVAEDAAQRAHIVLRGAGAVLDVDLRTRAVLARRAVCAAPRGIAYDSDDDTLRVTCMSGALYSLGASGGAPVLTVTLPDDLRDVVFDADVHRLFVSRFRSAQVLVVDPTSGAIDRTIPPGFINSGSMQPMSADVAWRMVHAQRPQSVLLLHQYARIDPICAGRGGYGGDQPIVQTATSEITASGVVASPRFPAGIATAVDVAISSTGATAIAVAGAAPGNGMPKIVRLEATGARVLGRYDSLIAGQVVAVAYTQSDLLLVQTRDPAMVYVDVDGAVSPVMLGAALPHDAGHQIFHAGTGGGLSCAGCHPEGGDDGHVWEFGGGRLRRTQNLRGGLLATAPFHWDGHFANIPGLLDDVFHGRMSGPQLSPDQSAAVQSWLDTLAAVRHDPPSDAAAVARGQALFNDAAVGCNGCHSGPHFTNNATVDVGTGGLFQVPSLVGVGQRAPYMHDGCVATLAGRIRNPCAGGDLHGHTAALTDPQVSDLVAYLQTL